MPQTPRQTLNPLILNVIRKKDGHTMVSLAARSGYSVGYINDLEKGRRRGNASVIRRLADVLNVPAEVLES